MIGRHARLCGEQGTGDCRFGQGSARPTDKRIFVISKAFRAGYTVDQVHALTKIDRWFLEKLMNIMDTSRELHSFMADGELPMIPVDLLRKAKVQRLL